jgi:GxxExxY protein
LLCYEKIIVELKAVKEITDEHKAQVMNYLKASGLQLGLLINFGHYPGLQWQRIVMSDDRNHEP